MAKITFSFEGAEWVVDAPEGSSVMRAAVAQGVEGIIAECGGNAMCATCHVYVDPDCGAAAALPSLSTRRTTCSTTRGVNGDPKASSRVRSPLPQSSTVLWWRLRATDSVRLARQRSAPSKPETAGPNTGTLVRGVTEVVYRLDGLRCLIFVQDASA